MPQAHFRGPPSPSAVSRVPALRKRLDLAMCRASGVSASLDGTHDLQQNSLLFVQFQSFHIMIFNDVLLTSHLHLWHNCTTMCAIYIFSLCVFLTTDFPKGAPPSPREYPIPLHTTCVTTYDCHPSELGFRWTLGIFDVNFAGNSLQMR